MMTQSCLILPSVKFLLFNILVQIIVHFVNNTMHLHEFLHLTYNYDALIQYLIDKQVIRDNIQCPKCRNIITYTNIFKSFIMHCTNKYYKTISGRKRQRITCNFKISMLNNTWFSKTHLDMVKICRFIGYFLIIKPPRQSLICNELEIHDKAVVDWTNFCREVCKLIFE